MASANITPKKFLSPAQKIKAYDYTGVRYVAARVSDTGLNDIQFTKMNAFGSYQKRPYDAVRSNSADGQSGESILNGVVSNPNAQQNTHNQQSIVDGQTWNSTYGIIGVNSAEPDGSHFTDLEFNNRDPNNERSFFETGDVNRYNFRDGGTYDDPANPGEYLTRGPLVQFSFRTSGVQNVNISSFYVDDSSSSLESDGKISLSDSTDISKPLSANAKLITNKQTPLQSFSWIGFLANTASQSIGMTYLNAEDRNIVINSILDGFVDERETFSSSDTEFYGGQFGLAQTRETQHKVDSIYDGNDDIIPENIMADRLAGYSDADDGVANPAPLDFARKDKTDIQYNVEPDKIMGPFVHPLDRSGVTGDLNSGRRSPSGPLGKESGGASWPGFERHPNDLQIDSEDTNTLWEDIVGNAYPLSKAANPLWDEFFRIGNTLRIVSLGDGTTTKTHFETSGWVANKDGHGANPAVGDTFVINPSTTNIGGLRNEIEFSGDDSLGTPSSVNQAYVTLVRTNAVTTSSLPVYSTKSLKKLTLATARFNDSAAGEYGPGSGPRAGELWTGLGKFEDHDGGGGFQVGRMIYQTADNEPYATTDLRGSITVTNATTYSAVIVESVVDKISEEWYMILANETGTFLNTRHLRSRQNGIKTNRQKNIYDYANGLVSTTNSTGFPFERNIYYAKYTVDKDGQVLAKLPDTVAGLDIPEYLNQSSHNANNVGYVDDIPSFGDTDTANGSYNAIWRIKNRDKDDLSIHILTSAAAGGVSNKESYDLADVSAPTVYNPSTRKNEIRASDMRNAVYPFKYECSLFEMASDFFQKYTTLSTGQPEYKDYGADNIWRDLPAINNGFLTNVGDVYINPDLNIGTMPRFDIPYDTVNPTAYKISTTKFTAKIQGNRVFQRISYREGKWYYSQIAHPGICIIRSNVFESTNRSDYNEIVAVARTLDDKVIGDGAAVDTQITCYIPAMEYIVEKPGSYIVTYIAKINNSDYSGSAAHRLSYKNHDGFGNAPIVTFETI